jgi:hypothetical protein
MNTRSKLLLLALLFAPSCFAQNNLVPVPPTFKTQGQNLQVVAGATITFCASGATGVPCSPLAQAYADSSNSNPINQSTNPLKTDALGNAPAFFAAPGNYVYTITGGGLSAPQGPYQITVSCIPGSTCAAVSVANTWTALQTFSMGLSSSGPNTLNGGGTTAGAWTHSGVHTFNAQPAFAVGVNFSGGQSIGSLSFNAGSTTVSGVGITTAQNNVTGETNQSETNGGAGGSPSFSVFGADLNRHCATISENNIPGGVPACLAAVQYYSPSSATTSSIGATTMVTVDAGGSSSANTYQFSAYVDQTVLGASCSGNSTVVVNVIFQDPNAASAQTQAIGTFTITTNGTLGIVPLTTPPGVLLIRAKTATNVQYSTTYTPGGSCSPAPTYQVYPILEKLN